MESMIMETTNKIRLSKGNEIIYMIEGIISLLILFYFIIKIITLGYSGEISLVFLLIFTVLVVYFFILPILFSRVSITEESVIITTTDINIVIKKENIIDIIKYPNNFLGLNRKYLQLNVKVNIYNRGLVHILLWWYKTNEINISRFEDRSVGLINKLIK
jgi:hypothetical protein